MVTHIMEKWFIFRSAKPSPQGAEPLPSQFFLEVNLHLYLQPLIENDQIRRGDTHWQGLLVVSHAIAYCINASRGLSACVFCSRAKAGAAISRNLYVLYRACHKIAL